MDRNRSRTVKPKRTLEENINSHYHHIYFDYTTNSYTTNYYNDVKICDRTESISDITKKHVKAVSRFRPWENETHECSHQKTIVKQTDGQFGVVKSHVDPGWDERTVTSIYGSALEYCIWKLPGFNPEDFANFGLSSLGTIDAASQVDWFSVKDSFAEACESLIPQSFFFGEDAVENDVFVDAFKILINPSKAVKTVVKLFKSYKRLRGGNRFGTRLPITLGNAPELVKGLANGHLLYQFAIRPAIDDIRSALGAHRKVESRLAYLQSHRGSFVPIKVRRKFRSSFSNIDRPAPVPSVPSGWAEIQEDWVTASISAYGKVRSDLTFAPKWAAYSEYFGLNKIVGTAWELIPFSFVIDWLTNAQEHINSMTRLRMSDPYTEIRNQMYSTKNVRTYDIYVVPPTVEGIYEITSSKSPRSVAQVTTSDYRRTYNCPGIPRLIAPSNLGLSQKASLGSVLIQKFL